MLRRADLLVSLLTYWQRHPRCRTCSQAASSVPRRRLRESTKDADALYELEIAFAEIARLTTSSSGVSESHPWVTDRALRHLLTDITGNTHRAEFCIDKLYSPDSARGRLGLLELRGFEMPPHHQMAMVQSLLVRSLVAWFWDEPLRAPLIRHGQNLHGRYLLPHFIIHDIADVAADLRANGIDFDTSWFDPFTEFRFPRLGTAVFDNVELELRGAIEPWNTLGEESTGSGTARYVDSSVERLQIRTIGADRQRHVIVCNGHPCRCWPPTIPDVLVGESATGPGNPERAASHHHRRHPAAVRNPGPRHRHLTRRLYVPRVASRRPGLRHSARQCGRGRITAGPAIRGDWLHARQDRRRRHSGEAGPSVHRRRRAWHSRSEAGAYGAELTDSSTRMPVGDSGKP